LITHDLPAALEVADRVVICRDGRTVDEARPADFTGGTLTHPYTRALWHALPANGFREDA
jgi:peptide/nickel transport system ATP-binding protein